MKLKILFLTLGLSFISPSVQADSLNFAHRDKQLHLITSAGLMNITYFSFRHLGFSKQESLLYGLLGTFALGLAKELTDPKFSTGDLGANALGINLGILIPLSFD